MLVSPFVPTATALIALLALTVSCSPANRSVADEAMVLDRTRPVEPELPIQIKRPDGRALGTLRWSKPDEDALLVYQPADKPPVPIRSEDDPAKRTVQYISVSGDRNQLFLYIVEPSWRGMIGAVETIDTRSGKRGRLSMSADQYMERVRRLFESTNPDAEGAEQTEH